MTYYQANSLEEIYSQLQTFYTYSETGRPALMEIFTPRDVNDKVLKEYFVSLS